MRRPFSDFENPPTGGFSKSENGRRTPPKKNVGGKSGGKSEGISVELIRSEQIVVIIVIKGFMYFCI